MSDSKNKRMLLLGIGNNGREDDGLGWVFADAIQSSGFHKIDVEYRYQLQVEDAELISKYDWVVFVDATQESLPEGFALKPCIPASHYFFSSHMQPPEVIVYLAGELYKAHPEAYTLALAGSSWELATGLSQSASCHLQQAVLFFENKFLPSCL